MALPVTDYDSLAQSAMGAIRDGKSWHRVVSIDLETKIASKKDFLTGERLLGIGFARRLPSGAAEVRALRLREDTDDAEMDLLNEAAKWMHAVRPLALVGYNISGYDFPLLSLKVKWYDDTLRGRQAEKPVFPREYWALKDALTRAYILDMMHVLRFEVARHDNAAPKYKSLAAIVSHPLYAGLPLMRRKGLAAAEGQEGKGARIFEMWKSRDPSFERYLEGDVHDVLVLAEKAFGI